MLLQKLEIQLTQFNKFPHLRNTASLAEALAWQNNTKTVQPMFLQINIY